MLARSTLIFGPAVILPRLTAFFVVLILTHTLPASEFGLYALVLLVGEMLDMTGSAWIRFALLRLDISNPQGWRDGFRRSYVLSAGATLLACAAALGVSRILAPDRIWEFFAAVSVYVASNAVLRMGLTSLQMRQKNVLFSALESARSIFQLIVVFLVLMTPFHSFLAFNVAMAFGAGCVGLIAIYFSRQGVPTATGASPDYLTRLKYGSSLIVLTFLAYVVMGSDRFFLKLIDGASFVGLYSAAYVLGRQPIDMVSNAINQAGFPELMKRFDAGGLPAAEKFISDTLELYALLMFTTLAALWSLSPYIAAVVLPPAYRATAVFVIPLIALAGTVQALKSGVFDNIFHMYRRNWSQFISYFPAAIVTTVVAFLLVKPYGAVGAGLAAFSGMSAGLIGSILMTRKFARVHIDVREHAKILLIAGLSGLSGMVAAELCRRLGAVLDLTAGVLACVAVWTSLVFLLRPRSIAGGVQNAAKRLRGIGQRLFVGA